MFSLGAGAIVYNGPNATAFEIDWSAAFHLVAANKTVHFGIKINSEVLAVTSAGVIGTFAKNNNQIYALGGTRVVILNNGDTIQLQVASSATSGDITVEHFTTTIAKFFRGL